MSRAGLACCDPEATAGARDRAIILTLLDTGMRVGELVRLTVEDFDFERQRLRILYGKGNKQRIVRFGDGSEVQLSPVGQQPPSTTLPHSDAPVS